nr:MAG TPA: hypothetical protein [Caudoviricetes sp.]
MKLFFQIYRAGFVKIQNICYFPVQTAVVAMAGRLANAISIQQIECLSFTLTP